jgi:heterodisulfide reductase subunit B
MPISSRCFSFVLICPYSVASLHLSEHITWRFKENEDEDMMHDCSWCHMSLHKYQKKKTGGILELGQHQVNEKYIIKHCW